jgi:hypothetical protein
MQRVVMNHKHGCNQSCIEEWHNLFCQHTSIRDTEASSEAKEENHDPRMLSSFTQYKKGGLFSNGIHIL